MRVYLVLAEWGAYSDHGDTCESVHLTYEGAVRAIETHVGTAVERLPGMPHEWDRPADEVAGDLLASDEILVFRHPTEVGGVWDIEGDTSWDPWSWHIEEREVLG